MKQYKQITVILFAFAITLALTTRAEYIVTGDETYNSSTMTSPITINSGSKLTGSLPASVTLLGSGTYASTASGNVFYGITPFDYSGFTGTIQLTTGRWMSQSYFEANLTMDVSNNAQVWIQSGKTVGWNFVLHNPGNMYDNLGLIRFDGNNSNITGNIVLTGAGKIAVRQDGSKSKDTISGVISGPGALTYATGSNRYNTFGTLILTGVNTYAGGTIINEGTLELQGNGTLSSGAVTINRDTAVRYDETNKVNFTPESGILSFNKSSDYVFVNSVSGNGIIQQIGSGKLTFNGATSFDNGVLSLNTASGSLDFGSLGSLGMFNYYQGTVSNSSGAPVAITNLNILGAITYANYLSQIAPNVTAANTPVIGNGGVVQVATHNDLASASGIFNTAGTGAIQFTGASFEINDSNSPYEFTQSVKIDPQVSLNCATETATVRVSNESAIVTFSAGMAEAVVGQNLIKTGAGTLVTPNVKYTGTTTVQAGTLNVTTKLAADSTSSSYQVDSGAALIIHEDFYESNASISGTGVLQLTLNPGGEILDTTNKGGFQGTLKLSGSTRFRNYAMGNYAGVSFDISNGAQFWIGSAGNWANLFNLSGTSGTYSDGRGAFRFDYSASGFSNANDNNNLPNMTGAFVLAGGTRISTIAGDGAGVGMISGVISGSGLLEKNDNFTIASNPLNARLILTGENTYTGGTTIEKGSIQLGYSGKVNNTTYDGTSGTLGTGALKIAATGALDFNRTNEYAFAGEITNSGTINVNSGTFSTSGAIIVPNAAASKINVAAGSTYKASGSVTLGTDSSHTINLAEATSVLATSSTLSSATTITGSGVWNCQFTGTEPTYGSFARFNNFTGTVNLKGVATGKNGTRLMISDKTGGSAVNWSGAQIVLDNRIELYLKNSTLTADLAFGASSGYDSGAAIRTDYSSATTLTTSTLNGTISLLEGTINSGATIYLKNGGVGNNFVINSDISGVGALTIKGDSNSMNQAILTSDEIEFNNGFQVSKAKVSLASGGRIQANSDITVADTGIFTIDPGATLAIGLDSATSGKTISINAANGTVGLNGTTEISVFSLTDYDTLDIASGTVDFTGSTLNLILPGDLSDFQGKVNVIDWLGGNGAATGLDSMILSMSSPGFIGSINGNQIVFGDSSSVPEPSAWALLIVGLFGLRLAYRKRR